MGGGDAPTGWTLEPLDDLGVWGAAYELDLRDLLGSDGGDGPTGEVDGLLEGRGLLMIDQRLDENSHLRRCGRARHRNHRSARARGTPGPRHDAKTCVLAS